MVVLKRKVEEPKSAEMKTIPVFPAEADVKETASAQEKTQ
jgi:hypothetical protein